MTTDEPIASVRVRPATLADIDALLTQRAVAFHGAGSGVASEDRSWEGACRQVLIDGFTAGDLIGAVAETDSGTIVASGIAALRRWLPSPTNPSGLKGYIESMTTLSDWRRQGIGTRLTVALIAALRKRGAVEIELRTTEAGEGIYRALGFSEPTAGSELTLHDTA